LRPVKDANKNSLVLLMGTRLIRAKVGLTFFNVDFWNVVFPARMALSPARRRRSQEIQQIETDKGMQQLR
jgi:hypothetical protein